MRGLVNQYSVFITNLFIVAVICYLLKSSYLPYTTKQLLLDLYLQEVFLLFYEDKKLSMNANLFWSLISYLFSPLTDVVLCTVMILDFY